MPSMQSSVRRRFGVCRITKPKTLAVCVAVLAIASMAGVAVAAGTTLGTGKAKVSGKSRTVVVDSSDATLYTLSGESVGHSTTSTKLKCVTKFCFTAWPPLKTTANAKLTRSSGVKGTLSWFKRVKGGFYQVTLNGHPLYTFASDKGHKGSAKGEGISAFGGNWHVVAG